MVVVGEAVGAQVADFQPGEVLHEVLIADPEFPVRVERQANGVLFVVGDIAPFR